MLGLSFLFSARMVKEHHAAADEKGLPRESKDEIREKSHSGFWKELDEDFQWLCGFVKDGRRSAVLIMDKNHCHTAFDMETGLTPGTYGWSRTVNDLRKKCIMPGVQLQFAAVVMPELFRGLDMDGQLWPHPFTPDAMLMILQRALKREGHLTRSNTEHDLVVRIMRYLKLFVKEEMLRSADLTSPAPDSVKALKLLQKQGFDHYFEISAITPNECVIVPGSSECEALKEIFALVPNYWEMRGDENKAAYNKMCSKINNLVQPLLKVDLSRLNQSRDDSRRAWTGAVESAVTDESFIVKIAKPFIPRPSADSTVRKRNQSVFCAEHVTSRLDQFINFGVLEIVIPIMTPCCGKTTAFDEMEKHLSTSNTIAFLYTRMDSTSTELLDSVKLLIMVKSSDEYTG